MSTGARLFGVFVVFVLLVGAVLADVYLVRLALIEQASGTSWQRTNGTITAVAVASRKTKNGKRYRPSITYEYDAGGETRTGRTIVIGESNGPSFKSEAAARKAYPQGASVPVFFDPANPADAALVVGLQKKTLVLLYLAGLLNALAVAWMRSSIRAFAFRNDPVRYYLVEDEPQRAVLRLSHLSALEWGLVWVGIAGAVCGVVIAVASLMSLPWIGIPVAAAAGLVGFLWRFASIRAGRHDVVVDRASGFVTLARRRGSGPSGAIDMAMIDRVEAVQTALPNAKKNTQPMADVVLHEAGSSQPRVVARWLAREEADVIAAWLRGECALEATG